MDELLDFTPDDTPKPIKITNYGKIFYRVEIALWVITILLLMMLMIYPAIVMLPMFIMFYLVLGTFFPFYSGLFNYKSDRLAVMLCMVSIALFFASIFFVSKLPPVSIVMGILSLSGNILVTLFIIARLMPATSRLALGIFENVSIHIKPDTNKHLGYLLIRLIPILLLSIVYFAKQLA